MRQRISLLVVAVLILAGSLFLDLGTSKASANVYCPASFCCVWLDVRCIGYGSCGFDQYGRCHCTVCPDVLE